MSTIIAPDELIELAQRNGVGTRRAKITVTTLLPMWTVQQVSGVLSQIHWQSRNHNPCGPKFNRYKGLSWKQQSFFWSILGLGLCLGGPIQFVYASVLLVRGRGWLEIREKAWRPLVRIWNLFGDMDSYIKAPLELVRKSVEQKAALCINRSGHFALRGKGDSYTVMSHVWEEIMGWTSPQGFGKVDLSLRKRGIHKSHFLAFFDRCNSDWLWVDVIAMPEVLEDAPSREQAEIENLRTDVINCLHGIYTTAEKVVILDSMTLQLNTGSLIDVAVTLAFGRWISRMWTYPEVRLAKKALIKTADGTVDFDDMLDLLRSGSNDESHRYHKLYHAFKLLRPNPTRTAGIGLGEIVNVFSHRFTGSSLDRARSVYPLLSLEWVHGWTEAEGMIHLVEVFKESAGGLAGMCGGRRFQPPHSWIPIHINGLCGSWADSMKVTDSGTIKGRWHTYRVVSTAAIVSTGEYGSDNWNMEFQIADHSVISAQVVIKPASLQVWRENAGKSCLAFAEGGNGYTFLMILQLQPSEVMVHYSAVLGSGLVENPVKCSTGGVFTWVLT